MKNFIGVVLAVIAGGLIGFYGVIVSVFTDAAIIERIIAVSLILAGYAVLGAIWGFVISEFAWRWGVLLGGPGVIFLCIYMIKEVDPYYLLYMLLIIIVACLGAKAGSMLKFRIKK